jgi:Divalent cation transporter
VTQRLYHRLPWLLLGLVGAMTSALLVGAFEEQLDKKVLLAFFVPAVVYMADAVGTQTETVLIRGLSVGVTVREVALRELLTGAVVGAVVGAAFVPFALVGWGDGEVAAAVALALFASCSIATLVAMALPWLFTGWPGIPRSAPAHSPRCFRTCSPSSSTWRSPRRWRPEGSQDQSTRGALYGSSAIGSSCHSFGSATSTSRG